MMFPELSIIELSHKREGHAPTCPCPFCRAWAERIQIIQDDPTRLGRRDLWAIVRRHEPACACRACVEWEGRWTAIEIVTTTMELAS